MTTTIKLIINEDEVKTANVSRCGVEAHIAANDRLSTEAEILKAIISDETEEIPVAYKYADPVDDARLIYCESELAEIMAADSSLVVLIEEVEEPEPPTILTCVSTEWLLQFSGIDFSDVPEVDREEAADELLEYVHDRLIDQALCPVSATGQKSTCHGWNGARFKFSNGPVASYDEVGSLNRAIISDAIKYATKNMMDKWAE